MSGTGRWTGRKGGTFVSRAELNPQQQAVLAAVPHWKRQWVRPAHLKPGQSPNFKVLKWVLSSDDPAQRDDTNGDNGVIVIEDDEVDDSAAADDAAPGDTTKIAGAGAAGITKEQVEAALQVAAETGQITQDVTMASSGPATAEASPSVFDTPAAVSTYPAATQTETTTESPQTASLNQPPTQGSQDGPATSVSEGAASQAQTGVATDADVTMQEPSEPAHRIAPESTALEEAAPPMEEVPVEGVRPADAPSQTGEPSNPVAQNAAPTSSMQEAVAELRQVDEPERLIGAGESRDVVMGEKPAFVEDEVQVAEEATQGMVGMTEPELKEGHA
ncbi:hypothetical protein ACM66B_004538 [Microbotryomycetes sp. NB124-2]